MLKTCLKSVIYGKVCVCACVCVMQNVSKTNKNFVSLECVAGGHQKATESEIRTHIGHTSKI